jgi:hypothetical protein
MFLKHSDCDGEWNSTQCAQLLAMFKKHKAAFQKSEHKKDWGKYYNKWIKAFTYITEHPESKIIFS